MDACDMRLIHENGFELTAEDLAPDDDYYTPDKHFVLDDGSRLHAYYDTAYAVYDDDEAFSFLDFVSFYDADDCETVYKIYGDSDKIDYVLSTIPDGVLAMDADSFYLMPETVDAQHRGENDEKVREILEQAGEGFDARTYLDVMRIKDDGGISLDVQRELLEHDLISRDFDVVAYANAYEAYCEACPDVEKFYIGDDESCRRIDACKELSKDGRERLNSVRDMLLDTSHITEVPPEAQLPGLTGRVIGASNSVIMDGDEVDTVSREVEVFYNIEDATDDEMCGLLVRSVSVFDAGNCPNASGDLRMGSARFGVSVTGLSSGEAWSCGVTAEVAEYDGVKRDDNGNVIYGELVPVDPGGFFVGLDRFTNVGFDDGLDLYEYAMPDGSVELPKAADAPLESMSKQFAAGCDFERKLDERNRELRELEEKRKRELKVLEEKANEVTSIVVYDSDELSFR